MNTYFVLLFLHLPFVHDLCLKVRLHLALLSNELTINKCQRINIKTMVILRKVNECIHLTLR